MTAIAYSYPHLAADSLITEADKLACWLDKVRVVKASSGVWLLTGTGDWSDISTWFDWIEGRLNCNGSMTDGIPAMPDAMGIAVSPTGDYYEYSSGKMTGPWRHENGWGYAHFLSGALDAGASAAEAVRLACCRVVSCGGPIKVYKAGVGLVEVIPDQPKVVKMCGSYVDKPAAAVSSSGIEWNAKEE